MQHIRGPSAAGAVQELITEQPEAVEATVVLVYFLHVALLDKCPVARPQRVNHWVRAGSKEPQPAPAALGHQTGLYVQYFFLVAPGKQPLLRGCRQIQQGSRGLGEGGMVGVARGRDCEEAGEE